MDLYTFGPLQQQHTHKNVESCVVVVAAAVFFGWAARKNKINRQQRRIEIIRMGKKNEKRKIWGSDLGPVRKSD